MGEFEMVFDGGTLHATWEDGNNLRYTRSTNSGVSFEPARTLDTFPSSHKDKTLAAAGGRVTIAVTKDVALSPNTSYVRVSPDGGVSFQPPVVVDSTFRDIHRPTLVVNGEEVHFFYSKWEDLPGTGVGIQYSVSRDGGETFSAPSQLSSHGPFTYFHQELAFGSQVWSFFNEQYNDFLGDLVLRASTDGGLSFGLPRLISADAYHSVSPEDFSIYNLNGTVLLSWMKKIPAPEPGMYDAADIFFARSIDCGLGNTELVNPIPAPPVLDEITVPVLQEGLTTEITVTASDPNYDALFFTGSNMPDFAVLDPQSGNQARWILEPPYGSAGTYPDVTVTVSDGVLTASQGITLRILASNQPPLARSSGPYTAPEGGELILDGSNSFDPEGGALVARWLLQGQSYDGLSVRVPVTDNFMEPVTLTVRDTFLYERSAEDLVQVYNLPPSVAVDRQGNRLASFTDPGTLDTHTATVDWGDGSPPEAAAVTESSGSGTVSGTHGYATSGTYTVTVTVRDKDGGLGTTRFSYTTAQNLYLPCVINR